MKMLNLKTALFLIASAPLVGCVMFDGADDFPQPCYGPDCMGGGLAQYGNAQYGHSGGHIGEPVFTPAAPVIPGGAPLPPGVTEVQLTPDEPSSKTNDNKGGSDDTPPPAPPNGVQSIDIPSPPAPTPTP